MNRSQLATLYCTRLRATRLFDCAIPKNSEGTAKEPTALHVSTAVYPLSTTVFEFRTTRLAIASFVRPASRRVCLSVRSVCRHRFGPAASSNAASISALSAGDSTSSTRSRSRRDPSSVSSSGSDGMLPCGSETETSALHACVVRTGWVWKNYR